MLTYRVCAMSFYEKMDKYIFLIWRSEPYRFPVVCYHLEKRRKDAASLQTIV